MNDISFATFLFSQVCFFLGFAVGRITTSQQQQPTVKSSGFFAKNPEQAAKLKTVKINESTYVTKVSSDSLMKKGGDLGKTSSVDDNISDAANKLAQLKRGKQ